MNHSADDIAEKVLSAITNEGYMDPLLVLSGEGAPDGAPFILVRPEDSSQVWRLRVEGPADTSTPEGIAEAAVMFGYADADPDPAPWVPGFQYADQGPQTVRGVDGSRSGA